MVVSREQGRAAFSRIGRGLGVVGSFLSLGLLAAGCTWLALVTLPGLGSLLAALAGLGETGARLTHGLVLALAVGSVAGGGVLVDRLPARGAIGLGSLVAGVGALGAAAVPGVATTAAVALCSILAVGLLLPALVVRATERAGPDRHGTALALVGVGYLLANAVVLASWYSLSNWLGLAATSHLLGDGLAGVTPRLLVYETFGSFREALLVVGGGLVAGAAGWAVSLWLSPGADRTQPGGGRPERSSPPPTWSSLGAGSSAVTALVAGSVAWTAATGLLVFAGAVDALTAPIVALAGRLLVVPLLVGVLAAGVALDRFGLAPVLGVSLVGGVVGPTAYSAVAGPATESVGATPPGTPWLVLSLLVTGLAVGGLVVALFALPASVPGVGDRTGAAAGLVLATAFVGALLARTLVPVDGRASLLVLALLVGPAVVGLVSVRWLGRSPPSPWPRTAGHSGERK